MPARSTLALVVCLLAPCTAHATTADDVPCAPGSPPPAPCIVSVALSISDGSILDFGSRGVVISASGSMNVGAGAFTIRAASLELQTGGNVLGAGGSVSIVTTGPVQVEASAQNRARIDVSAAVPGDISIDTGSAPVEIDGLLLANSTVANGDGGVIDVTAGAITLGSNAKLSATASASGGGLGGEISLFGEMALEALGTIDVSGGQFGGGAISLETEGNLVAGPLDASGGESSGGATIDVSATGDVTLTGPVNGHAGGSEELGGGTGADVTVFANGAIAIQAPVTLSGAGPDGSGGTLDLAAEGDIVQSAAIDATAPSPSGTGGVATFFSTAGRVAIGDIAIGSPGVGGTLSAMAANEIEVTGVLDASGALALIELRGCAVRVPAGTGLSADGAGGANHILASTTIQVAGFLTAGESNTIEYLHDAPELTGTITPSATLVANPALPPCHLEPGTTTSSTSTSTTTTTITTTTLAPTTSTVATTTTTSSTTTTASPTTSTTVPGSTSTTTTLASTTTTVVSTTSTSTSSLPAAVCDPHDPLACDDGDRCTEDLCHGGAGCGHVGITGYDGVACRLGAIATTLADAPPVALGGHGAQLRLANRVTKMRRLLDAARDASGRAVKVRLHRTSRLLAAFRQAVEKGMRRGRIDPAVADRLFTLADGAANELLPLEAAARSAR